jgi:hypothetical protein
LPNTPYSLEFTAGALEKSLIELAGNTLVRVFDKNALRDAVLSRLHKKAQFLSPFIDKNGS